MSHELSSQTSTTPAIAVSNRAILRELLEELFSFDDLRNITYDLGWDYEKFPSNSKGSFCRDFLLHLERRGQIACLLILILRLCDDDRIVSLLPHYPPCGSRKKVQVIVDTDDIDEANKIEGIVQELALRAGISIDAIAIIGTRKGSLKLLLGMPEEAANALMTRANESLTLFDHQITSITEYDKLDKDDQQKWRALVINSRPHGSDKPIFRKPYANTWLDLLRQQIGTQIALICTVATGLLWLALILIAPDANPWVHYLLGAVLFIPSLVALVMQLMPTVTQDFRYVQPGFGAIVTDKRGATKIYESSDTQQRISFSPSAGETIERIDCRTRLIESSVRYRLSDDSNIALQVIVMWRIVSISKYRRRAQNPQKLVLKKIESSISRLIHNYQGDFDSLVTQLYSQIDHILARTNFESSDYGIQVSFIDLKPPESSSSTKTDEANETASQDLFTLKEHLLAKKRRVLFEALRTQMNIDEINELCTNLEINPEKIPSTTISNKALHLVLYCERHNLLIDLEEAIHELRPSLNL